MKSWISAKHRLATARCPAASWAAHMIGRATIPGLPAATGSMVAVMNCRENI